MYLTTRVSGFTVLELQPLVICHCEMWRCLVQFAIIFQLFQCIQGVLRPFNTHQHKEDIELFRESLNALFRSDINSDRDVNIPAKPALRTHRQNTGGNPEYSAYNYLGDSNQYARVSYLGEGSKVNILLLLYYVVWYGLL